MRRLTLFTLLLGVGACEAPTPHFRFDCDPRCLSETSVRLASDDIIVRNPGIWRFYDDYARQLPPACGSDAGVLEGTLVPLWKRTLNPITRTSTFNSAEGHRSAVAVHPNGTVAVAAGGTVWLLDANTGVPTHGLMAASRVGFSVFGFAVFTPDGKSLWVNGGDPMRLDLTSWDRIAGPAAYRYQGDAFSSGLVPGVASDGTIFFLGSLGRALEPSGQVRWERSGVNGTARVDAADRVFWSRAQPPRALDPITGDEVWRAQLRPEWFESELINAENVPTRSLIPMRNLSNGPHTVSLHRASDGNIERVIEPRTDAGTSVRANRSAQSGDGTLYLTYLLGSSQGAVLNERVVAYDEATGAQKWVKEFPELATAPLVGAGGDVFVATKDCRLSVLSPDGEVRRSFLMAARPTGDLLQLTDGVLYVVTSINPGLNVGERVFPGDSLPVREDGGIPRVEDYDCPRGDPLLCAPEIKGDVSELFVLYAFRVE